MLWPVTPPDPATAAASHDSAGFVAPTPLPDACDETRAIGAETSHALDRR